MAWYEVNILPMTNQMGSDVGFPFINTRHIHFLDKIMWKEVYTI